jgi:hypothetical protein
LVLLQGWCVAAGSVVEVKGQTATLACEWPSTGAVDGTKPPSLHCDEKRADIVGTQHLTGKADNSCTVSPFSGKDQDMGHCRFLWRKAKRSEVAVARLPGGVAGDKTARQLDPPPRGPAGMIIDDGDKGNESTASN